MESSFLAYLLFIKKYILLIFLVSYSFILISQNPCSNTKEYGFKEICMPKLDNMKECYDEELYKLYADEFKGTAEEIILAFYISENDYSDFYLNILNEKQVLNDPYCKIYSTTLVKDVYIDESNLDFLEESIIKYMEQVDDSFSLSENLNEIMKESNVTFQAPLLLDHYKTIDNIRTIVSLLYYTMDAEIVKMTTIMHLIVIKNRLFFMACYEEYNDFASIKEIEKKSNFYAEELLRINK